MAALMAQCQLAVTAGGTTIYELAVLRPYAEPPLSRISPQEPEYIEARRLIGFLRHFRSAPESLVPLNSILREFIG